MFSVSELIHRNDRYNRYRRIAMKAPCFQLARRYKRGSLGDLGSVVSHGIGIYFNCRRQDDAVMVQSESIRGFAVTEK
jgi:hypothetical protein